MKNHFKTLGNHVLDHDLFGHRIALNFNRGGDTHRTIVGGFFSIFIKIALTFYVFIKVVKLVSFGDD